MPIRSLAKPQCIGKVRFPGYKAAKAATEKIGKPLRPYRCDVCRGVHLTKQAKRKVML